MTQKNSQMTNSDVKLELLERLDAIGYDKIIHQGGVLSIPMKFYLIF